MERYGTEEPKTIDYTKIKTKFAIFGGIHDVIIKPDDIQVLIDLMPRNSVIFSRLDYNLDHSGFFVSNILPHMNDTLDVLRTYARHK